MAIVLRSVPNCATHANQGAPADLRVLLQRQIYPIGHSIISVLTLKRNHCAGEVASMGEATRKRNSRHRRIRAPQQSTPWGKIYDATRTAGSSPVGVRAQAPRPRPTCACPAHTLRGCARLAPVAHALRQLRTPCASCARLWRSCARLAPVAPALRELRSPLAKLRTLCAVAQHFADDAQPRSIVAIAMSTRTLGARPTILAPQFNSRAGGRPFTRTPRPGCRSRPDSGASGTERRRRRRRSAER